MYVDVLFSCLRKGSEGLAAVTSCFYDGVVHMLLLLVFGIDNRPLLLLGSLIPTCDCSDR